MAGRKSYALLRQTAALYAVLNGQQGREVQVSQRAPGFIVGALAFVCRKRGRRLAMRVLSPDNDSLVAGNGCDFQIESQCPQVAAKR